MPDKCVSDGSGKEEARSSPIRLWASDYPIRGALSSDGKISLTDALQEQHGDEEVGDEDEHAA